MTGMEIPLLMGATAGTAATTASGAALSSALLAAPAASAAGFSAVSTGGILASLGGFSSLMSLGSGLFSAYSTLQSGREANYASKVEAQQMQMQAEFERTRAMQDEANRQARLNEILGLQMAGQAGRGTAIGSGTDIALSDFSEEEARRESDIANLDSKFQQTQLKSRAAQSRMSGKASLLNSRYAAASTLFDTGTKAYERRLT